MPTQADSARIARTYRTLNRACAAAACAALLWPVATAWLARLAPDAVPVCASVRLFHRPCALCGITRGLTSLARGDWPAAQQWNPLTIPIAVLLVLELAYRIPASFYPWRETGAARAARLDLIIHVTLIGCFVTYALGFTLRLWTAPAI